MLDPIFITKTDAEALGRLLAALRAGNSPLAHDLERLEHELDRAEIVEKHALPPTVVTINAEVQLEDLDSGERLRYRLVLPREARAAHDISILAPVGTAILGYRAGDIVEWPVPKGIRRLKIHEVVPPPAT